MRKAVVVADGRLHAETALGALAAAGCDAVTVPGAAEARAYLEAGAVVVVVGSSGEPLDAGPSRSLATLPPTLRRACVIAVVADGFTTGDGMAAFLAGADLAVAGTDLSRLGELVAGAIAAKRTLVGPLDPAAAVRLGG